ncbi:MAG: 30S ribosomal protein S17 [Planctomycetes bacterium]|nr:30S ribosomal protein S17 [Planctomycetota bacterium]
MKVRGKRKTVQGVVTSDSMEKSIVVAVERLVEHPKYGKRIRRSTKFFAHDEADEARAGDKVEIAETRPLSKKKRWRLVRILERA